MKTTTIAFTGGHHNSALVIAKHLKREGYSIIWFGHKFTSRGDKSLSAEFQEVTRAGIQFIELKTGKFYHHQNPTEYLKIFLGFIQSFGYLLHYQPQLIFASGGYLSVPIVIVGWLLGIPSITHEQTVVAGWANKAISPFVSKILLTHQSSLRNFPKGKTSVVGLPLRSEILNPNLKKSFSPPLLYISCGKQGSHLVNQAIFPLIPKLVKKYTIYHQTGANTLTKDLDKARRVRESLTQFQSRYHYSPYFFDKEAGTYLHSAKIVISRAGAHAAYELSYLKKKTIFIPISWVSHNEQFLNATIAKKYTQCLILTEDQLTPESLENAIVQLAKTPLPKKHPPLISNATAKIVSIIKTQLSQKAS